MAGPSLHGPLTGWTASTITPVAATVAQVRKQSATPPPGMPDPATLSAAELAGWGRWEDAAIKRQEEAKTRLASAAALEKEAVATNDPVKLGEAWQAFKRTTFDTAIDTNARLEEQKRLSDEFKKRNPTFDFGVPTSGKPGADFFSLQDKLIAEAPAGQVRDYMSKKLFEQTGLGSGQPIASVSGATAPLSAGGSPFAGAAGVRSTGGGGGGGGGPSAYDLTDEELAGGGGPNPRASAQPTTPLEQLLRTIYPDAPVSGANPLADPRAQAGGSGFNDVLAYLNNQRAAGSAPGYVASPMLSASPVGGPSVGAQIASTIPGAPGFLSSAINNLGSFGGASAVAPVAAARSFDPLIGLSAISAEQRIQKAQLDARIKAEQDAYLAQQKAEQAAAARKAQLQRLGGGWQSPISFPTF